MNKFERIVKLLQLTQSSNDYEALSAMRKANRLLAELKLDWIGFIRAIEREAHRAAAEATLARMRSVQQAQQQPWPGQYYRVETVPGQQAHRRGAGIDSGLLAAILRSVGL